MQVLVAIHELLFCVLWFSHGAIADAGLYVFSTGFEGW
jgi:hypothetical protein